MEKIIEVKNIVKSYPKIRALDEVSLDIFTGECIGLIGPNGAGKTTLIEIIEGIRKPDRGTVLYKGKPIAKNYQEEIGIQLQKSEFPHFLTVRETLKLFRGLYSKKTDLDELFDICDLHEFIERDNRKISGGQFQRLSLAAALINDPTVIFLDEPTTGLDPEARRNMWDMVSSLKSEGKTIFLTTHYMEEAEELCDRIGVLDHGRIIELGTPGELCKKYQTGKYIEVGKEEKDKIDAEKIKFIESKDTVKILTHDIEQSIQRLIKAGIDLNKIKIYNQNLDDIYVKLIGSKALTK